MQKLFRTELCWIICELENNAEEFKQMSIKTENGIEREFFNLRSENLYSVAEKLRIAIDNEDKRIAII